MTTFVFDPKNTIRCIDSVWMAVSVDASDNTEGVCAVSVGGMQMPLIAADEARLPFVRTQAQLVAKHSGKRVKVIRLSTRDVIEEFDTDGSSIPFC